MRSRRWRVRSWRRRAMPDAGGAGWKLRRLLAMGPKEIALRATRSLRNRIRRPAAPRSLLEIATPSRVLARETGGAGADDSIRAILDAEHGRLLAGGADRDALRGAIAELGVRPQAVRERAERILDGEIPAFGYTALDLGVPPRWLRDPSSGREWPLDYWASLDFRTAEDLGDPRCVWELNRHHHLVTLARAYALSGDVRFAEGVWDAVRSWAEQNPPYFGINWVSPLEIGIRLISWAVALDLVGADGARPGDAALAGVAVSLQAAHLSDNLSSYGSSRNNHLIGEAAGVLVAGAKFPFLEGASRWVELGRRVLDREIAAQTTPDGVGREQAFGYQAFILEFAVAGLVAAAAAGRPLGAPFAGRVARMVEFLDAVAGPSGVPPSVGDADGGRVLELADEPLRAAARAATTAACAVGAPVPDGARGADFEPCVWLFGAEKTDAWLSAGRPPGRPADGVCSGGFPEGGYFVLAGRGQHGVVDCGPLGYLSLAAHGHADCLSLAVCCEGRWLVTDPGTYCYHREPLWRDHFRSTRAHSTILVDGQDQSEMLGPFLWGRRAGAAPGVWVRAPECDCFAGRHNGYESTLGVRHERTIVFGRRGYWLVLDRLTGEGEHRVRATFQLAPGMRAGEGEPLLFCDERDLRVTIEAWLPGGVSVRVAEGENDPPEGWVSEGFGEKRPAPAVVAEGEVTLPAVLAFGLVASAGLPDVRLEGRLDAAGGLDAAAIFPEGRDRCLLGRVDAGSTRFAGTFGQTVARDGDRRRYGICVDEWTEEGTAVEFARLENELATPS